VVAYFLRTGLFKFKSFPSAINHVYGPTGLLLFLVTLLYRLNNEVWSNSIVVASFYGEYHSSEWWWAAWFSVIVPMIYVLMGGMRSSLLSDVFQALLAIIILIIILSIIGNNMTPGENIFKIGPLLVKGKKNEPPTKAQWTLPGGLDLWLGGSIQGLFSYAFHDPVLTDRAFLSDPKTMAKSFFAGGIVAALFIVFFGLLGILGISMGSANGEPRTITEDVSNSFMLCVCFCMMTSSLSTLDSTLTSSAKIFALDIGGYFRWLRNSDYSKSYFLWANENARPLQPDDPQLNNRHIIVGRVGILLWALIGTLPLLEQADALNATTISGTVVMGLGPPIFLMLCAKKTWHRGHCAFSFSVICGIVIGFFYQSKICPTQKYLDISEFMSSNETAQYLSTCNATSSGNYFSAFLTSQIAEAIECKNKVAYFKDKTGWHIGTGAYKAFLGVNLYGFLLCILSCLFGWVLDQYVFKAGEIGLVKEMEEKQRDVTGNNPISI